MTEQNLSGAHNESVSGGENKKTENSQSSSLRTFVVLGLVAAAVLLATGAGVYKVYAKTSTDKFSLAVAKVLHLPAVKVGDKKILYTSYAEDLKAIHIMRDYDKSQIDAGVSPERAPGANLTEEQMSDQVLWRLVNNLFVEKAAKEYMVVIEDKDVENLQAKMLENFTNKDVAEQELTKRYGWTMDAYEKKVMRPFILQTKLAQKMKEDSKMKEELKSKAEKVLEEVKNGADFAVLAKQYNADGTRETGGDLGWFGKGDMVPEFEKAAYSLKKGAVYPTLVETAYGFHIIKLDDKKIEKVKDEKGKTVNAEQVRASQILFAFPNLLTYLDSAAKNSKIRLYLKVHNPFEPLYSRPVGIEE